jgi:hypothetical protein
VGVVGDGTGCGFRLLPLLRFLPSKAQLRDIPLRPSLEQLVQTGRQAPLESLPQGNIQVRDPPVGTDALFPPPAGAGEQSCVGLRTRERFRRYRGHLSGRVPIGWEWPIPEHSIELWEEHGERRSDVAEAIDRRESKLAAEMLPHSQFVHAIGEQSIDFGDVLLLLDQICYECIAKSRRNL